MEELSDDRISRLKCISCGSNFKRQMDIIDHGTKIGFSTICCNCGHIENYMINQNNRVSDAKVWAKIQFGMPDTINTAKCAVDDTRFCDKNCKYLKENILKEKNEENQDTVVEVNRPKFS